MLRIGLLGASRIAPRAIVEPALRRNDVVIAAVAARDDTRARNYAQHYSIARSFDNYEALLADEEIDLIYNALPPVAHLEWTLKALRAGKHVLCEKPFAMNAREAQTMVACAQDEGRALIEAFHYRFHPLMARISSLVESGVIGTLCSLDAIFDVRITKKPGELRYNAALGGGAMMDLGCYALHLLRTVAGAEPEIRSAVARVDEDDIQVDTAMSAELQFAEGVTASLHCAMVHEHQTRRVASLKLSGDIGELTVDNPFSPHSGHSLSWIQNGVSHIETVNGRSTYDHQLDHVVDVICNGAVCLTGGVDAIENMKAIDAIYRASGLEIRG